MPHILNMPILFQEKLNRPNTSLISPKVLLYVEGYEITSLLGGQFQYDTNNKENHCFEVTKAVKNDKVVIAKTIPELPTFDGSGSITQYSNVKIQLQKMYGDFWQYVGQGAGITKLMGSSVEIKAVVEGMPNLPLFKGTIKTAPEEEHEHVTFDVRSSMWDIVGKELLTNQYNTQAYTVFGTGLLTEVTNDYVGVTTPNQRLIYHHPIVTFNEIGQSKVIVKASESSSVDLLRVNLLNNKTARLGKYTMKWLSPTQFEFTTPTAGTTTITHSSINASGSLYVVLPAALQNETGIFSIETHINNPVTPNPYTDIKGKSIEFWFAYTVHGNPISIVLDMIIRTITGNWNTNAAVTLDPQIPCNYGIFQEMELLFNFTTLYVSEWNDSNDVYSYKNDSKPLQAKNIIQKVLDHIGCQLTYDTEGKISINTNWFYNDTNPLWRLGSIHCGAKGNTFTASHSLKTAKEYKRMELFYGYNPMTKNAAGKIVKFDPDALVGIYGINDKPPTYAITLPYYKAGVSDLVVNAIAEYLWKWVKVSHIRLSATVLPQFGLSLDVGDKFIADFTISPILPNTDKGIGKFFMIYGINKKIGAEVEIECIATPDPIIPSKWCEAYWCMGARWK